MNITVIKADYFNLQHEKDILYLLDAYASDPMGGGKPLDTEVKRTVVRKLSELPYAFSLIAYADDVPVGLVNCFESFSTFSAKPLINIHDFAVIESHRGKESARSCLIRLKR